LPKPDDRLRLGQQLCFALYSASRAVVRAYAPLLEALGLTYPQYITLLVLWEEDGLSVRALGDRLGLDSATLTPLLKRLQEQALITRARDPRDERVVRIRLTANGKALKKKAARIPASLAARAGYDLDNRAALKRFAQLRDELIALAAKIET
jgi:DNA-binding MarR family transcriptional regulator